MLTFGFFNFKIVDHSSYINSMISLKSKEWYTRLDIYLSVSLVLVKQISKKVVAPMKKYGKLVKIITMEI